MNFGKAVLMGIGGKKMKRKDLALTLNIPLSYAHDICNNNEQPSLNLLIEMAELFEVRLSTFISWGE